MFRGQATSALWGHLIMIRFFALLASLLAFVAAPASAEAAYMFGKEETIHRLQDVDVTSQDNEPLFLGYKTTTTYFIAGVSITDDGYVFGLRSDSTKYIETTPEEIAKFQASGLLPDPLPPYKLGILDYVIGYSLWTIVLPILVIVFVVSMVRKRKAPVTTPPAA